MQNISITTAKHFQKLSQILELVISISCFRDAEIPKKKSTKYKIKKANIPKATTTSGIINSLLSTPSKIILNSLVMPKLGAKAITNKDPLLNSAIFSKYLIIKLY